MVKYRFTLTSRPLSPITSLLRYDTFWRSKLCSSLILLYLLVVCMYEQMAGVWYFTARLFLILPTICNLNNSYIKVALQGIGGNDSKIQHPVTKWRLTVSFMSPAILPLGKQAPHKLSKRTVRPQSSRGYFGEKSIYCQKSNHDPSVTHSLVIVPTVLVISHQH